METPNTKYNVRNASSKPGRKPKPSAVDLFSGCGGLSEGLRQAGFKVVGAIECEPLAVETYRKNHRGVKVLAERIEGVSAAGFRQKLKLEPFGLDLLAGCPPCQGFSSMTTLNGKLPKADERNELVFQFVKFVREFMPRAIMMENVPGLASDERAKRVCDELIELGYSPEIRVLNAANYAVPQRRRRMILLAGYNGKIDFAEECKDRVTVSEAFKVFSRMNFKNDALHSTRENRSEEVIARIRAIPKDGGSRSDLGEDVQLKCHKVCNGFKDVYGRMSWNSVAPTITGGCCNPSKGRFLHPEEDRAITPREAAILQSFPPQYYFSPKKGKFAVAQMIGNALPPEFIRRHALKVIDYLRLTRPIHQG